MELHQIYKLVDLSPYSDRYLLLYNYAAIPFLSVEYTFRD